MSEDDYLGKSCNPQGEYLLKGVSDEILMPEEGNCIVPEDYIPNQRKKEPVRITGGKVFINEALRYRTQINPDEPSGLDV